MCACLIICFPHSTQTNNSEGHRNDDNKIYNRKGTIQFRATGNEKWLNKDFYSRMFDMSNTQISHIVYLIIWTEKNNNSIMVYLEGVLNCYTEGYILLKIRIFKWFIFSLIQQMSVWFIYHRSNRWNLESWPLNSNSPTSRGCSIQRLHLCTGVRPHP